MEHSPECSLKPSNAVLILLLSIFLLTGLFSILLEAAIVPLLLHSGYMAKMVTGLERTDRLIVAETTPFADQTADTSPLILNITLQLRDQAEGEFVKAYSVSQNESVESVDCEKQAHGPNGAFSCILPINYAYHDRENVVVYPVLVDDSGEKSARPFSLAIDWRPYKGYFWSVSAVLAAIAAAGMFFCLLLVGIILKISSKSVHDTVFDGEYSFKSLLAPLYRVNTHRHGYENFITSGLFWTLEMAAIAFLIAYMALGSQAYLSWEAAYAFIIGGLFSFPLPFLVVAIFWMADYKEREPLPVMVSLMLWGGVACLLSVGINDLFNGVFGVMGLGFLTAPFIAPLVEELFKGTALVLFCFHHEFDDMVDGIVYGMTIGMGFTFIEDWLYLINNPIGSNVGAWLAIFAMRSLVFCLNHGVFTACTGAVIGYLKQRNVSWAPYGLFIGLIPAVCLHFLHNIITAIAPLLGNLGSLLIVLGVLPILDFSGAILILSLMAYGVYKAKSS